MDEEIKNPAAVELGKLGGQKTAERGPEYYAEINAQRKTKAGGRPKNPPKATHAGVIRIGNASLDCANLPDGRRVISEAAIMRALGRGYSGYYSQRDAAAEEGSAVLPRYVAPLALKPFIPDELVALLSEPIAYIPTGGTIAKGVEAQALPKICRVWIEARNAGKLNTAQKRTAAKAEMLSFGFAEVGIAALVDEATGYQEVRDRKALQAILDAYLRKEIAAWSKKFPDEFYQQMFRLRGWQWKGMKVNRPQVVGHYTNDLVWDRIAPGLRKELELRNPKNERGRRIGANTQWLTENIGDPALAQHLYALVGFMRVCPDKAWKQFYSMVQIAFPKKGDNLTLQFGDDGE